MSVQTMSRIAALLALDAKKLGDFLVSENADGEDENEESRASFVHYYRHQLEENEKQILLDGDMNEVFLYIEAHLPKPVNGERPD